MLNANASVQSVVTQMQSGSCLRLFLCRQRKAVAKAAVNAMPAAPEDAVVHMEVDEGNAMLGESSMHGQMGKHRKAARTQKTQNGRRQKGIMRRN